MSDWGDFSSSFTGVFFDVGGEPIYYSRPASGRLDSVDEFETVGIPDTSLASAGDTAKQRVMQVQISAIPLGPKKGDILRYGANSYRVEDVLSVVPEDDTANLGIRMLSVNA